jgi:uncharacterized protein YqgC (DUF456 family)
MNTTQSNYGSGNTVAFLFGAVFNLLANTDFSSLTDYSLKAVIGGIIMMLFKLLSDYISKKLFSKKKGGKRIGLRKNKNSTSSKDSIRME